MQSIRMLGLGFVCTVVAACDQKTEAAVSPQPVRVASAIALQYQPNAEITGEVKARIQSELSFRISGRVVERTVNVGSHVRAGTVLARVNDTEQQADVSVARAAVEAAQAVLHQKTLAFERAQKLAASQVVAQEVLDMSRKELSSAKASLEAAEAAMATAEDVLSYTLLKAEADGIVTSRNIEVGQVVAAAQPAFTLAHDGPREAVFNVFEAFFLDGPPLPDVSVAMVGDRSQGTTATIREVSPVIDTRGGTIRIKVQLPENTHWPLGTPVVGTLRSATREGIVLPYSAIASAKGSSAVWVINQDDQTVSLRPVAIDRYRKSDFVVAGGIVPHELVVTEGGKLLREGRAVAWTGN